MKNNCYNSFIVFTLFYDLIENRLIEFQIIEEMSFLYKC